MIDLNAVRRMFGEYICGQPDARWRIDAALVHVCEHVYRQGIQDAMGAGASIWPTADDLAETLYEIGWRPSSDGRHAGVRKLWEQLHGTTAAARDVIAERHRQIGVEGWSTDHDDCHAMGELATAAACYAGNAGGYVWEGGWPGEVWPWAREWWKPGTARRDLVKAGALILAEIDRLDRAAERLGGGK